MTQNPWQPKIRPARFMRKIGHSMQIIPEPPRFEEIPVALLAGGLATRLGSLSAQTPKALIDIDGRPFIDHQLDLLQSSGIRRVVICLGHMGRQIEDYLGDGDRREMEIRYSYDGPRLLGTGGALCQALPMLGDLFWIMYGDSYMDIDYRAVMASFNRVGAAAMMTVIRNDDSWDRSNARFEDGRLTCYDKVNRTRDMRHIDYGVQILRREALSQLVAGERCDLADVYRGLVAHGRMMGFEVFNRFYEIGTPEALEETRRHLAFGRPPRLRKSA